MEEERNIPKNIGDQVSASNVIMISEILSVVPMKYNGIDDTYDVCEPSRATHDGIINKDGSCIIMSKQCINRDAIIDIL